MKLKRHMKLLVIMSAAWFVFWVLGLPDYYKQYSTLQMIVFDAAVLPLLSFVVYYVLSRTRRKSMMPLALWLAFYMTVPLFLYDLLYCGYYLDYGFGFLSEYWYLTVYYFIPWLVFPLIGRAIKRWQMKRAPAES